MYNFFNFMYVHICIYKYTHIYPWHTKSIQWCSCAHGFRGDHLGLGSLLGLLLCILPREESSQQSYPCELGQWSSWKDPGWYNNRTYILRITNSCLIEHLCIFYYSLWTRSLCVRSILNTKRQSHFFKKMKIKCCTTFRSMVDHVFDGVPIRM